MNKLFVNLCVAGAGMAMLASCQSTANKENVTRIKNYLAVNGAK